MRAVPLRCEVVLTRTPQAKLFDTSYEPSPEWWSQNQLDYVRPEGEDPLPEGFPAHVNPKALWDGKILINQRKWRNQPAGNIHSRPR